MHAAPRFADRSAPLWDPAFEHDSCGVGLVVDIAGRPSRQIVERALAGLVNLTHRGGVGADSRTGDGAGVLTQVPHALFGENLAAAGHADLGPGELGVAMTFLPRDEDHAAAARQALDEAVRGRGLEPIVWRTVPVDPGALGDQAVSSMPRIEQLLIRRPDGMAEEIFERELFLARKAADRAAAAADWPDFFVVSCSARTLIYKAFCLPGTCRCSTSTCRIRATKARSSSSTSAIDQHPPHLGDGPAVPLPGPQRRDQHRSAATGSGWRRGRPSSSSRTARR